MPRQICLGIRFLCIEFVGHLVLNMGALVFDRVNDLVGLCPVNSIGDDALNILIVEGGAGFVTGLEVEDLTCAAEEAAACAEDEAVLIPCAEYQFIGLGNVEGLAVKLFLLDEEVVGDACGNGMSGEQIPHDLLLITAPRKVTVGADNGLEGLGVVAGVECDEAHLAEIYAILDLLYQLVIDFAVSHVTPPKQNIGVFQNIIRQTLIGIVESGQTNLKILVLVEKCLDGGMQTVGVDRLDVFLRLFVTELVPNCYADFFHMYRPYLS